MKHRYAVLIIAVIGGVGWYGYTRWYEPPDAAAVRREAGFPVERALTDRTGRMVAARLLAHDSVQIRFIRTSDGATYDYPIRYLSDDDQQFIRQFPESSLGPLPTNPSSATTASTHSTAMSRLRAERAELEHKIRLMTLELRKENNKSPILSRDQIQQRIHDCRNRIIDIDQQLLELEFRSGTE